MIVEQGFAYIKLLWCSQAIIKSNGRVLGLNASVYRVDIGQHLVRPVALNQMHCGLTRETRQRLRAIPGLGQEGRTELRLDLTKHLDHMADAALGAVRGNPILALDGIFAEAERAREFIGSGA